MAKKNRAWFIDNSALQPRMGIVEKATNTVTKDGYSSDYSAITEAKDITIYAIARDYDLVINALTATWTQIPGQFHDIMLNKAISDGYKKADKFDGERALFFDNEYRLGLKEVKKFSKGNYQTTGNIVPHEF